MPRFAVARGRDLLTFLFVIDILVLGAVPVVVSGVLVRAFALAMRAMLSFFIGIHLRSLRFREEFIDISVRAAYSSIMRIVCDPVTYGAGQTA